jgi:hypothetical protein
MTAPALDIRGSGHSFAVLQGGQVVAGPFTSHGNAIAALPGVERRLRPSRLIACLCCGGDMRSTGPGERLCPACRGEA